MGEEVTREDVASLQLLTKALLHVGIEAPLAAREDEDAHESYCHYLAEGLIEYLTEQAASCSPCASGAHHACEDDDSEPCCCGPLLEVERG